MYHAYSLAAQLGPYSFPLEERMDRVEGLGTWPRTSMKFRVLVLVDTKYISPSKDGRLLSVKKRRLQSKPKNLVDR